MGLITVLSCGIVFSVLMSYKKLSYAAVFHPASNSVISTILVLLIPLLLTIGGAVFWIADITNLLLIYYPTDENEYRMFARLMSGGVASIITICIIAPFIEEMLFRGIILKSFLVNYSTNRSIILSALLFSAYHLTITQLPVTFIVGCLFGWLYVRTRSLWPCILGHALYNSFAMLLWSRYYSANNQAMSFSPEFNPVSVMIVSILSSTIGGFMLISILKSKEKARS